MKRLLLLFLVLFVSFTATAQMNDVFRQIQQNKREIAEQKQIEDVLATLPQNYVVAYAKNGVLCYLLKDGKRISYVQKAPTVCNYVWYTVPSDVTLGTMLKKNNLAELIDSLSNQGWKMSVAVGNEYEVYTFNRPKNLEKR